MNKKFMKVRRIAVPTLTLIIMASQFMGCAANTQETMKMMEGNQEAGAADLDSDKATSNNEQTGDIKEKEEELGWTELASLETMPEIRENWETTVGVQKTDTGKEGMFYTNSKGENDNNNTLMGALSSFGFLNSIVSAQNGDMSFYQKALLAYFTSNSYTDIDSLEIPDDLHVDDLKVDNEETYNTAFLAGLNAYYNLLPDKEQGKANMNESLTRKEFMAMVYRADTPVQEVKEDEDFTKAVGNSEYNVYAQNLKNNSYLATDSGMDESTYNSAISRAEAIYMLVNRYYRDDLSKINTNNIDVKFTDAKDNGMSGQDKLDALNESIKDADKGLPTELYAGLAVASERNIINPEEDTRWDESLTKEEALQLLINAYTSNTGTVASLSSDEFEFKTAEQKETDKEAERKAEQERLIEEYKQAVANGDTGDGSAASRAKASFWNGLTAEEQAAYDNDFFMESGYREEQHPDGSHYLVDIFTGDIVEIGGNTVSGYQYEGNIENCRADAIKWFRFNNPDTDKTDEWIASFYGF